MAYYGIPSAAASLTATNSHDTISILGRGTTLTAQSVNGADGNDIISIGAVGKTAVASATISMASGWDGSTTEKVITTAIAALVDSATTTLTGKVTATASVTTGTSVHLTGVITSEQATRTANSIYLQGNAGNDTIALGDSLILASASTFAGGQGDDYILGATNINNVWAGTATALDATVINAGAIEGGNGNDTITLQGAAYFSAVSLNANKGNDVVDIRSAHLASTLIGLGAGNDNYSGIATGANASTIAGGKGNDFIDLTFTRGIVNSGNIVAGDRGNNVVLDGDGNDSIAITVTAAATMASGTIYGGGGNDSITIAGTGTTNALFVSMNAGADVFTALSSHAIKSSFIGMGAGDDLIDIAKSADVLNTDIHLGKGNDTVTFNGNDIGSATNASGTTIYGGAGADLLATDAIISSGDTVLAAFEYQADSDSTLASMDTIAVMHTAASSTYTVLYQVGGASRAVFSAAGATATNTGSLLLYF